ncbi:DUF3240 family protein [Helicobacter ailurogastricus]|uniref:Cobalt-zinc-cadmium resistance protein CzcA Cation efflux system protein CusA n=1 Tax=Helicobacter ailurogastricus TaxID=1578720 RepID=A0A0K2X7D6_9HELI|nr:DUF3240 family protein [Helicobacter ailurogastricus]GMB89835.1 DUF3240 domain-containing protein [Helicobacter ailurogastricus]CRF41508.1 Cobalt-zinc-cadmium resistance protein CzcA; Cation efflux system protein CusA [Helicobacter ailurogastricus]CRF42976.1 Cobalt-zinc-cadmium resistance protein CzcA; Cation efflux system protein CusA [Helicobacter ailurogastricus]CRF43705.1 Cobalt-zinc-cadmium resistance protein CzcA; Cation efflux system protein CusA [Helicobacter ailurogastricus]
MVLVEIYADLAIKDMIVDHLFAHGHEDFYFGECFEYATSTLLKSEKEQVSGRKDYGLFKLYLEEERAQVLAKQIHALNKEATLYLIPLGAISTPLA